MSVGASNLSSQPSFARRLVVAVAAALATAAQVLWAGPDAPSAADGSASPLPYLPWLCLVALLTTGAWLALSARRLRPGVQIAAFVPALTGYWLLLDYHEFSVRVAAWSTFGAASLWLHVLRASALPIVVCAAVFALISWRALRGMHASGR
ncbi:hypothetical protein QFW77_18675 [Luteimonas sp. RD2P54]|uniref:Tryptophan-rich sensory protein n=1 Tax=Luteimonas endophytica TaxID=3042023 RepID=A0ABT6JDV3_9GAMM|nr:hypothetical protein [Luteimonas endophytica]MDH5824996.1 hypothetical protein [Luteimonas endophytica]